MREQLQWLVVLADEENVTAAASRLGTTQPTLSRALDRLERRLGHRLFDRQGRRLVLNEAGRRYTDRVRRAEAELAAAEQELADLADEPRTVRLGFLHSFGTWLVPDLIRRVRDADPRIHVELEQDGPDRLCAQVLQDRLDLAVVSPRPGTAGLAWQRLLHQQIVAALPGHHGLAARERVSMLDLAQEPFVAMASGYGLRQILDEACAAAGFSPRIAVECQELDTVAGLVAAGVGVALLPQEREPRLPRGLASRPLTEQLGRDIGLVWDQARPLPEPARLVRELARR